MKNFFTGKKEFKNPVVNLNSQEPEVNKWIISDFIINHLHTVVGHHPFPLDELMLMTSTVCRFKPELIFEWGTNIGKSARIFYEIVTAFQLNCQIHSVDLPDEVEHGEHPKSERGRMVRGKKNVFLHQGDGLDTSLQIISKNPGAKRILFFVDGDHSYDSVKRELSTILEKVPEAVVLLHDTFYQSEDSKYNTGPNRAIQELVGNKGYKIISTVFGLPGMTLLVKSNA